MTTRAMIVALKCPVGGRSASDLARILGLSARAINATYSRALKRGFDPARRPLVILEEYLLDEPRSGRPTKAEKAAKLAAAAAAAEARGEDPSTLQGQKALPKGKVVVEHAPVSEAFANQEPVEPTGVPPPYNIISPFYPGPRPAEARL